MQAFEASMDWIKTHPNAGYFWFRGVNNIAHSLLPSAHWRKDYQEWEPLLDFVQEGRAYAPVGELDDWRTYYLAQHHGIPTRLLDWTESFLAALFFALDRWDGQTTPGVWILRPELLNEISISWQGIVTPEQNRELDIWLPSAIRRGPVMKTTIDGKYIYDNKLPLAIYPRKENARIVAQQGTFTVSGTEIVELDHWIGSRHKNPKSVICRIDLERMDRESTLHQLSALGARRHSMYPDVTNYVEYLKQKHRW